jgi:glycosyltransferase involved in cell wall biosynthesis
MLYIAKFMPRKNQLFLPDVMSLLPEDYKLVLAGPSVTSGPLAQRDAEYMQALKAKIIQFGLEHRVKIVNEFVDSASYMKTCDLYCIPAWDEGLGTPMLEAMTCGLPVICSEEDAFKEWLVSGRNGETLPLDANLWADKIQVYLGSMDADKRGSISAEIIRSVSMERIAHGYIDIIRTLT